MRNRRRNQPPSGDQANEIASDSVSNQNATGRVHSLVGAWRDRHHRTRDMTEWTLARPRALVIGGSVGGLFAAHLLRDVGWDVTVFERAASDLGDRGTGIGTREELFAVMRRIGLANDASIGIGVEGRVGLDRDGRVIHELRVHAVTSAWSRIWRPLRQAWPSECYAVGKTLVGIEQNDENVSAVFDDGSRACSVTSVQE